MSVPASVLRREQIERATRQARERLEREREEAARTVQQLTERLSGELAGLLQQLAGPDGSLPPEILPLLEQLIAQQLQRTDAEWRVILAAAVAQAVRRGAAAAARGEAYRGIIARTTAFLDAFRAADGLSLSDRLWRVSRQLQDDVLTVLRTTVALGIDAARSAEMLIAASKPVPDAVATAARGRYADQVARRLRGALTGDGGSAEFILNRLLRTEVNRAYTESFVEGLRGIDGIAGVRFRLSPLHPRFDICDLHAAANLHGMGPGVYPLGAHPYPAHPQTLSFLQPVFEDEISDVDRNAKQTAFEWIRRLPSEQQDAVLGAAKKGAAFRAGQLLPEELRWPWYAIAERLGVRP